MNRTHILNPGKKKKNGSPADAKEGKEKKEREREKRENSGPMRARGFDHPEEKKKGGKRRENRRAFGPTLCGGEGQLTM